MDQPKPQQPETGAQAQQAQEELHTLEEQNRGRSFKEIMRQPVSIAALSLTLGVGALVAYLERGSFQIELQPPEVSYELLSNEGLTEGVPIAIKLNEVAVFKIDDPMQGGAANRAKEIVATLEQFIEEMIEDPKANVLTLDVESADLPAIIHTGIDGMIKTPVVQLTAGDVVLSGQEDAKWMARVWAERLTDSLKLFVYGQEPQETMTSEFGEALATLYLRAREERGSVSKGSLEDAFETLTDVQKSALLSFPPPEEPAEGTPGASSEE